MNEQYLEGKLYEGKSVDQIKWTDFETLSAFYNYVPWLYAQVPEEIPGNSLEEIFGEEFCKGFNEQLAFLKKEEKEKEYKEKIKDFELRLYEACNLHDAATVKFIFHFDIAHMGWELDNDYYIFEIDGKQRLFGTDHGQIREQNSLFLNVEYKESLRQLTDILKAATLLSVALSVPD